MENFLAHRQNYFYLYMCEIFNYDDNELSTVFYFPVKSYFCQLLLKICVFKIVMSWISL